MGQEGRQLGVVAAVMHPTQPMDSRQIVEFRGIIAAQNGYHRPFCLGVIGGNGGRIQHLLALLRA